MKNILLAIPFLVLASCISLTDQQSANLRTAAFSQLELWRTQFPNAGYIEDPVIRLSIVSACALGGTIVTVVDPTVPTMPERLQAWCSEIIKATSPETM